MNEFQTVSPLESFMQLNRSIKVAINEYTDESLINHEIIPNAIELTCFNVNEGGSIY